MRRPAKWPRTIPNRSMPTQTPQPWPWRGCVRPCPRPSSNTSPTLTTRLLSLSCTTRAVDAFNVAPVQAGSLHRAQRLSQLAAAAGVPRLARQHGRARHWHGRGRAFLAWLLKPSALPSDLVGPGLLASDVVAPRLTYQQGCLHAPPGPGLGVELIPELMEQKGTS